MATIRQHGSLSLLDNPKYHLVLIGVRLWFDENIRLHPDSVHEGALDFRHSYAGRHFMSSFPLLPEVFANKLSNPEYARSNFPVYISESWPTATISRLAGTPRRYGFYAMDHFTHAFKGIGDLARNHPDREILMEFPWRIGEDHYQDDLLPLLQELPDNVTVWKCALFLRNIHERRLR